MCTRHHELFFSEIRERGWASRVLTHWLVSSLSDVIESCTHLPWAAGITFHAGLESSVHWRWASSSLVELCRRLGGEGHVFCVCCPGSLSMCSVSIKSVNEAFLKIARVEAIPVTFQFWIHWFSISNQSGFGWIIKIIKIRNIYTLTPACRCDFPLSSSYPLFWCSLYLETCLFVNEALWGCNRKPERTFWTLRGLCFSSPPFPLMLNLKERASFQVDVTSLRFVKLFFTPCSIDLC